MLIDPSGFSSLAKAFRDFSEETARKPGESYLSFLDRLYRMGYTTSEIAYYWSQSTGRNPPSRRAIPLGPAGPSQCVGKSKPKVKYVKNLFPVRFFTEGV